VCGVAGLLAESKLLVDKTDCMVPLANALEISYLSTAMAGTVIVGCEQATLVARALTWDRAGLEHGRDTVPDDGEREAAPR